MALIAPIPGQIRELGRKFGIMLIEQDFTLPTGETSTWALWSVHSSKGSASIVMPITTEGKILALRQYRYGAKDFMLELPGGMPSPGESAADAAKKELLEETGYEVGRMVSLGVKPFICAPRCDYRLELLLAMQCRKVAEPKLEAEEIAEHVEMAIEEWYRRVWAGEVLDGQMISLSMLALPHLANIKFK